MIINKALENLILKAFRNAFDIVEKKKFCCQEPIYEGKLFEHCFGESLKGIITVTISRDRFEPQVGGEKENFTPAQRPKGSLSSKKNTEKSHNWVFGSREVAL